VAVDVPDTPADPSDPLGFVPSQAPVGARAARRRRYPEVAEEVLLARVVAGRVGADHTSLALVAGAGPGRRAELWGSAVSLVELGDMTETVGEGPGHDVLRTGTVCQVSDLPASSRRWPLLLSTFDVPGQLRSVVALPLAGFGSLRRPEDVFGLLVLARRDLAPFTAAQVTVARRGAGQLAAMFMARAGRGSTVMADEDLDAIVDSRAGVIPQAVGHLIAVRHMSADAAGHHLQTTAFAAGLTVHQIALRVVAGGR
jgi:hypothetical protein